MVELVYTTDLKSVEEIHEGSTPSIPTFKLFMRYLLIYFRHLYISCQCHYRPKREFESEREYIKDTSCMYHWMKSKFYKKKLKRLKM